MILKNSAPKGGKVLNNTAQRGPYILTTDTAVEADRPRTKPNHPPRLAGNEAGAEEPEEGGITGRTRLRSYIEGLPMKSIHAGGALRWEKVPDRVRQTRIGLRGVRNGRENPWEMTLRGDGNGIPRDRRPPQSRRRVRGIRDARTPRSCGVRLRTHDGAERRRTWWNEPPEAGLRRCDGLRIVSVTPEYGGNVWGDLPAESGHASNAWVNRVGESEHISSA